MSRCPDAASLQMFLLGQLSTDETEELGRHIETCERCVETLESLKTRDVLVEAVEGSATLAPEPPRPVIEGLLVRVLGLKAEPTADRSNPHDTQSGLLSLDTTLELAKVLSPPREPGEMGQLGPYRILSAIGAGGMGVVFLAHDPSLQRRVALKVLRPALLHRPLARQRFLQEARTAAAFTHDHVVSVYQVGEENGVPFLAMQLLEGESLDARLKRFGRLPVPEVLRLGREVAIGLASAHARGLIHRDIKPANVWLEALPDDVGTSARERVKILDFGLACAVDAEDARDGNVAGTPAYMAPEQAAGEALDGRCDLYSLGCLLYQCSTGRLPFPGAKSVTVVRHAQFELPPTPTTLNVDVPPALSDLILRLLARRPDDRPRTAREVIAAITAIERSTGITPRRARTRFTPLLLVAAIVALIPLGLFVAPRFNRPQVDQKEPDRPAPVTTLVIDQLSRDRIPAYELAVAGGGDPAKAPEGLVAILGDSRLKHWDGVHSVSFSPDGKLLASGSWDRTVKLWDAATGRELHTFSGHPEGVYSVGFCLDGRLMSASSDGTVKLWDPIAGKELQTFSIPHQGRNNDVAISRDGETLASAGWDDHTVRVWKAATGEELFVLDAGPKGVHRVAFSHDGKCVAAACHDGTARVWDVATGKPLQSLPVSPHEVMSVAFSPDGKWLAVGDEDAAVTVWELASEKKLQTFTGHRFQIHSVVFRADGVLASGADDGTVKLWDCTTGAELRTLSRHYWNVCALAFAADSPIMATGSLDRSIRVWDSNTGKELIPTAGHECLVDSLAFHPAGRLLATGGGDHALRIWDLATATEERVLYGHQKGVGPVAFRPDGEVLASCSIDGTVKLWQTDTWKVHTISGRNKVSSVAYTQDGQFLAAGDAAGNVRIWETATLKELKTLEEHQNWIGHIAFSPDGRTLALGREDGLVKVWDVDAGKEIHSLPGHREHVHAVAFRGDGRVLAAAGHDGTLSLWDPATGQELHTLTGHERVVNYVAFPREGKLLASAAGDGTVRIWDSETGKAIRVFRLAPNGAHVNKLAFSPDGRHVATANSNSTVYIFRVAPVTGGK